MIRPESGVLTLGPGEVHLWQAELDRPPEQRMELARYLDAEERERSRRFHFPHDACRFTLAHGLLRLILSRYLGAAPERVSFTYGEHGKPELAGGEICLHFNLSHSHNRMLVGLSKTGRIGVDIERMRTDMNVELVARQFLASQEMEALLSLPAELRPAAFSACWTRKEAYAKALGKGLQLPFNQFAVSVDPYVPARLLYGAEGPAEAVHWSLLSVFPGHGYIGAVAVDGPVTGLTGWEVSRANPHAAFIIPNTASTLLA